MSNPFGPMRVSDRIRCYIEFKLGIRTVTLDDINNAHTLKRDKEFERLRVSRLRVGFIRYESKLGRAPDYRARAAKAIEDYRATGNREYLVDAANYVELEWIHPSQEGTFFESTNQKHERGSE